MKGMAVATGEYELAKTAAVVVPSARRRPLLTGADVADFLQGQVSNDIDALLPGSGCYATLLTAKGKIRCDMRILRGEDWFLLDSEPQALPVLEHMVRVYSICRDVKSERDERPRPQVRARRAAALVDHRPGCPRFARQPAAGDRARPHAGRAWGLRRHR